MVWNYGRAVFNPAFCCYLQSGDGRINGACVGNCGSGSCFTCYLLDHFCESPPHTAEAVDGALLNFSEIGQYIQTPLWSRYLHFRCLYCRSRISLCDSVPAACRYCSRFCDYRQYSWTEKKMGNPRGSWPYPFTAQGAVLPLVLFGCDYVSFGASLCILLVGAIWDK